MTDGRFTSLESYRRYQGTVARDGLLPMVKRAGLDLAGRRLLDLGCGFGAVAASCAELGLDYLGVGAGPDGLEEILKTKAVGTVVATLGTTAAGAWKLRAAPARHGWVMVRAPACPRLGV